MCILWQTILLVVIDTLLEFDIYHSGISGGIFLMSGEGGGRRSSLLLTITRLTLTCLLAQVTLGQPPGLGSIFNRKKIIFFFTPFSFKNLDDIITRVRIYKDMIRDFDMTVMTCILSKIMVSWMMNWYISVCPSLLWILHSIFSQSSLNLHSIFTKSSLNLHSIFTQSSLNLRAVLEQS